MKSEKHTAIATDIRSCQQKKTGEHMVVSAADSGANIEGTPESTAAHAIGSGPQSADNAPAEISAEFVDGTVSSAKNTDAEYRDGEFGKIDLAMSLPESRPRRGQSPVRRDFLSQRKVLLSRRSASTRGSLAPEIGREHGFSFFRGLTDKNPRTITIECFARLTALGEWSQEVARVRAAQSDEQRKAAKRSLPAVTVSGEFIGGHRAEQLELHSGLICMDFDLKDNHYLADSLNDLKGKLSQDQFVKFAFISASGTGLAVICCIDPNRHADAFDGLSNYLSQTYGLKADPSCKDVSRLRFVSHDPAAALNPNAVVFDRYAKIGVSIPAKAETSLSDRMKLSPERTREIESALTVLSPDNYDDWVKVGMGIHSECPGMAGFSIWQKWSILNDAAEKYDEGDSITTWQSFGQRGGLTIGTLFKMAKDAGWKPVDPSRANGQVVEKHTALVSVNADAWMAIDPDPVDAVVSNLFDTGDKICIIGPSKSFKTFIVLQLALSIAAGRDFLVWKIPKARRVLMVQLEVKETHFHGRVRKVWAAMGITSLDGRFEIANGRGMDVVVSGIATKAVEVNAEVVIIDPIYKLLKGDENSARDWKPLLAEFDQLAETGVAVVYVHHDAKGAAGDRQAQDRGAGSGILARDYDCALTITPHATGGALKVIEAIKRNYPSEPAFTAMWEDGVFELSDKAPLAMTSRSSNKNPTTDQPLEDFLEHVSDCLGEAESGVLNKGRLTDVVRASTGLTKDRSKQLIELAVEQDVIVTNHGLGLSRKQVLYAVSQDQLDTEIERLNAKTSEK